MRTLLGSGTPWSGVIRFLWDPTETTPASATRDITAITHVEFHHTGRRGLRSMSFEHKRRRLPTIERMHEPDEGWIGIFHHIFIFAFTFADGEVWVGRPRQPDEPGSTAGTVLPRPGWVRLPELSPASPGNGFRR